METNREDTAQKRVVIFRRVLAVCIWGGLILLCLFNRDKITVENIVSFTPKAPVIAALVMLCLFALKSVTVFVYGGLLYAASGILFPLPAAILVNILGTAVMTTIPFLIGKKAGKNVMGELIQKNPKLEILQDIPNRNEFFVSLFMRIIGLLPAASPGTVPCTQNGCSPPFWVRSEGNQSQSSPQAIRVRSGRTP